MIAAVVATLALVAGGVPVAACTPAPCADCCHDAALRRGDATMPACCRVAPAARPVARESTNRASPRATFTPVPLASPVIRLRVQGRITPACPAQPAALRIE